MAFCRPRHSREKINSVSVSTPSPERRQVPCGKIYRGQRQSCGRALVLTLARRRLRGRRFDIGDVDPVTRDFLAIGVDDQAGLAEFANDRELGKTWRFV